jgi:hypothetical protein
VPAVEQFYEIVFVGGAGVAAAAVDLADDDIGRDARFFRRRGGKRDGEQPAHAEDQRRNEDEPDK